MDWLNDLPCLYRFRCNKCGFSDLIEYKGSEDEDEIKTHKYDCDQAKCDGQLEFAGFEKRKLDIMVKTTFEKNGRVGVEVTNGDKKYVRSMTKENYLNGKGTDSVLTKGCKEQSEKAKKHIVYNKMQRWKNEIAKENYDEKQRRRK